MRFGLTPRNFHPTRHIAASLLLRFNGGNLAEVKQILGHSTYRITIDLYSHLSVEAQRATSERVTDHFLGGQTAKEPAGPAGNAGIRPKRRAGGLRRSRPPVSGARRAPKAAR